MGGGRVIAVGVLAGLLFAAALRAAEFVAGQIGRSGGAAAIEESYVIVYRWLCAFTLSE